MSLLAQHGYGKSNKIEKAMDALDIDGVVLSPKAESPDKTIEYSHSLMSNYPSSKIYFDPQFFVCHFQKDINSGKLPLYPYYQSKLTRAKLSAPANIRFYTERVLTFQEQFNVTASISPTIIIDSFNGPESQIAINFAYESIDASSNTDRLLISLCINELAFTDKNATDEFLNVISLLDVRGFYIIIDRKSNTNKAANMDSSILSNIMHFLYVLSEINKYHVLIGYSDLLSIPLATVCNADFACGWYSNSKSFSVLNYSPTSGGRRPRKRYTSGPLMSAILHVPELHELCRHEIISSILSDSQYTSLIFPSINDTAWTDEVNCLHNWHVLSGIINEISSMESVSSKLELVINKISIAESIFEEISHILPQLDEKSNGNHLSMWKEAINLFKEESI